MVHSFPKRGEGGEDEVHETIEVGHVEREYLDNDLGTEENEGSTETDLQGFEYGPLWMVEFSVQVLVSGLFDQLYLLSLEQDGCKCLLEEEKSCDLDQGIGNSSGPEHPSPCGFHCNEAASDGTNRRSEKWSETVDTYGTSTLLGSEKI